MSRGLVLSERLCEFPECGWARISESYCEQHYNQSKSGRALSPVKRKRAPAPCSFSGCDRQIKTRKLCSGHYQQLQKGQELRPLRKVYADDVPLEVRFWDQVTKDPEGCWLWTGAVTGAGYGQLSIKRQHYYVHRLSLELHGIAVGEDMHVDHQCHTPLCIRPDHLRVVEPWVNQQNRTFKPNSSGYRGVHKNGAGWAARIYHDGSDVYLGYFKEETLAAEAVRKYVEDNGIIWDSRTVLAA